MAETDMANRPRWGIAPYFIVDDVVAALGFPHRR